VVGGASRRRYAHAILPGRQPASPAMGVDLSISVHRIPHDLSDTAVTRRGRFYTALFLPCNAIRRAGTRRVSRRHSPPRKRPGPGLPVIPWPFAARERPWLPYYVHPPPNASRFSRQWQPEVRPRRCTNQRRAIFGQVGDRHSIDTTPSRYEYWFTATHSELVATSSM